MQTIVTSVHVFYRDGDRSLCGGIFGKKTNGSVIEIEGVQIAKQYGKSITGPNHRSDRTGLGFVDMTGPAL